MRLSEVITRPTRQSDGKVACQQLIFAEQAGVLERFEVGQVIQRIEQEVGEEGFRGDIGVGCARRRAALPCTVIEVSPEGYFEAAPHGCTVPVCKFLQLG